MRKRWPHPPPKGHKCDAHVSKPEGWEKPEQSIGLELYVFRCQEPAVETLIWGQFENGMEVWLCSEHADYFVEKGTYHRNPKRKPK